MVEFYAINQYVTLNRNSMAVYSIADARPEAFWSRFWRVWRQFRLICRRIGAASSDFMPKTYPSWPPAQPNAESGSAGRTGSHTILPGVEHADLSRAQRVSLGEE
jgi:hypothetical protein